MEAEETGKTLLALLYQVRRYKGEHGLSVGARLETLHVTVAPARHAALQAVLVDLKSATRAEYIALEARRQEGQRDTLNTATLTLDI